METGGLSTMMAVASQHFRDHPQPGHAAVLPESTKNDPKRMTENEASANPRVSNAEPAFPRLPANRTLRGHHKADANEPNRTWRSRLLDHLVGREDDGENSQPGSAFWEQATLLSSWATRESPRSRRRRAQRRKRPSCCRAWWRSRSSR